MLIFPSRIKTLQRVSNGVLRSLGHPLHSHTAPRQASATHTFSNLNVLHSRRSAFSSAPSSYSAADSGSKNFKRRERYQEAFADITALNQRSATVGLSTLAATLAGGTLLYEWFSSSTANAEADVSSHGKNPCHLPLITTAFIDVRNFCNKQGT